MKKQFLLLISEENSVLLRHFMPQIELLEVAGMDVTDNTYVKVLVSPITPQVVEPNLPVTDEVKDG